MVDREQMDSEIAREFVAQLQEEMAAGVAKPQGLMLLAMMGRLRDAPVQAFTEQALLQTESEGFNCLHHAARNNELDVLPPAFRTQHYFSTRDGFGQTVFHYAAQSGCLHQIPRELLTEENLMAADRHGYCALQHAAEHNHLEQVPRDFTTPEKLAAAAALRTRILE